MLPKLLNFLLIFLISTYIQTDARRSRIDLPITNAADAPPNDNIATATGVEPLAVKVPAPESDVVDMASVGTTLGQLTPTPASISTDSHGSVAEIEEECDPDMIGFEIVTG